MKKAPLTPAQTVGPFFHPAMLRDDLPRNTLVLPTTEGERIRIEGCVVDGAGEPVPDAFVEIWQANAHGRYNHPADNGKGRLDPGFLGFARADTDDAGRYWFETIRPGRVAYTDGRLQAPHIALTIFARGLLHHLLSRMYFDDEPSNAEDPILHLIPVERRSTLIATRVEDERGGIIFRHDIVLQGDDETVFLNPIDF